MTRFNFCILFAVAIQACCYADVTKLSTEHRKALHASSRFHEVHTTADLPPAVVALCADDEGKLAEPGQKWQATDAITDPTRPRKRLIWAATDGEHYVVHNERGGRGHSFHILVATFKASDSKGKVVWMGSGNKLKDYSAFLAALEQNKLDDTREYAH